MFWSFEKGQPARRGGLETRMEWLDGFDANYRPIGKVSRSRAHEEGIWHRTFHAWIARPRERELLFQLRSESKPTHPGKLDVSCGGHIACGESPEDGVRELREELGLDWGIGRLHALGYKIDVCDEGALKNREFAHVYIGACGQDLEDYDLRDGEAAGLAAFGLEELDAFFSGAVPVLKGKLWKPGGAAARAEFCMDDFVARPDRYYWKAARLAAAYLDGQRDLWI